MFSFDLSVDQMQKAKLLDLIALARFAGIPDDEIQKYCEPNNLTNDTRYRLSCLISRWNSRHPQKPKKRIRRIVRKRNQDIERY